MGYVIDCPTTNNNKHPNGRHSGRLQPLFLNVRQGWKCLTDTNILIINQGGQRLLRLSTNNNGWHLRRLHHCSQMLEEAGSA
jgi:hypothetical protein